MHVERQPADAFDRLPLTPVAIGPFDPSSKQAALAYGTWLTDWKDTSPTSSFPFSEARSPCELPS